MVPRPHRHVTDRFFFAANGVVCGDPTVTFTCVSLLCESRPRLPFVCWPLASLLYNVLPA